jgi:hypothetical protein
MFEFQKRRFNFGTSEASSSFFAKELVDRKHTHSIRMARIINTPKKEGPIYPKLNIYARNVPWPLA